VDFKAEQIPWKFPLGTTPCTAAQLCARAPDDFQDRRLTRVIMKRARSPARFVQLSFPRTLVSPLTPPIGSPISEIGRLQAPRGGFIAELRFRERNSISARRDSGSKSVVSMSIATGEALPAISDTVIDRYAARAFSATLNSGGLRARREPSRGRESRRAASSSSLKMRARELHNPRQRRIKRRRRA